MAHITLVVAHIVAFNMCTNSAYTADKRVGKGGGGGCFKRVSLKKG